MSARERVVVVGASAAGLTTTETLRRGGYEGEIVVVGEERHQPYDRPPLSKQLLAGTWDPDKTALRSSYDDLDADFRLGCRATQLDLARRAVELDGADWLAFDALVIATGARPRGLSRGLELAGVHLLRTLDDALALRDELVAGRRLVVVGAGYVGTEVAATARERGVDVLVVDPLPVPVARPFGIKVGALVAQLHREHGVELRLGVGLVELIEAGGRIAAAALDDGTTEPADVVVIAIGASPATEWLLGSGLVIGDGVECDEYCVAAPGVYAAGDVASWINPRFARSRMRVEHRMNATEQGAAVAKAILGAHEPFAPVPYFWTDQFTVKLQAYGVFPARAEVSVHHGDLGLERFVLAYESDGVVVGAVGWNAPRELRAMRAAIVERASAAEASAQ